MLLQEVLNEKKKKVSLEHCVLKGLNDWIQLVYPKAYHAFFIMIF